MGKTAARVSHSVTLSSIIADDLVPLAARIDSEGLYPAEILRRLGEAGAFIQHASTLNRSTNKNGLSLSVAAMAEVAAVCLSTAFCTWCQDALVWYLDRADNASPRERYLTDVCSGRVLGGTGLSNPMKFFSGLAPLALKGVRVAGGYRVSGRLPYVSNLDAGHLFAGVFELTDAPGRRIMALFRAGYDGVRLARNAHFIALEGTGTYSVLMRDVFVPQEHVLSDDADRFLPRIRNGFVLLQAGMGLGLARGVARLMRADGPGRHAAAHLPLGPDAIETRADALSERVAALARHAEDPERQVFLEVLRTRLAISWLALESAQAAMLQFGARGYLSGSEPARRLREAQFVAIISPSVKHILAELATHPSALHR